MLVAQPDGKRTTLFQGELARLGYAPAQVVSWAEVARAPEIVAERAPRDAIVKLDSAGRHAQVERALLARGAAAEDIDPPALPPIERGLIVAPRLVHAGFVDALRGIDRALAGRPDVTLATPIRSVEALFDKRVTSRTWRRLGVAVPEPIEAGAELDSLLAAMHSRGVQSAYVKVAFSSSAALLALVSRRGGRPHAMTTVETVGDRRYGSRRLQRVGGRALASLVRFLLAQGAQVEVAEPKARLAGRHMDARVVVIGGAASVVVVRTSSIPITNLHLGGTRGDLGALRSACPPDAWARAMAEAERAAAAFPSVSVGIDLMFTPRFRAHRVLEGNAFGDFFPGLVQDDESVYARVIESLDAL